MKAIHELVDIKPYHSKLFDLYFHDCRIIAFDIETTGLFPHHDQIILSGLLDTGGDTVSATQFFCDQTGDEPSLIRNTLDVLTQADVILTYNGSSFDLPFLEKRAAKYGIPVSLNYCHLDLYSVLSSFSGLKDGIRSLSQKNVERFMGVDTMRADRISGGDSVRLYERFMTTRGFDLERQILLHNHDDILQLYRLLPSIELSDFHASVARFGFPAGIFPSCTASVSSQGLTVCATAPESIREDRIQFPTVDEPYELHMSKESGELQILFPSETVARGVDVIDARTLLRGTASDLDRYPEFESGYLILRDHSQINYLGINLFAIRFLKQLSSTL